MKHTLLLTLTILFSLNLASAQKLLEKIFTWENIPYLLSVEDAGLGAFKISIDTIGTTTNSEFTLKPLELKLFQMSFKQSIAKLKITSITSEQNESLELLSRELFFEIIAAKILKGSDDNDGPIAGTLKTKEIRIKASKVKNKKNSSDTIEYFLDISNVQIEFYDGYIENISIEGTINNEIMSFENRAPIGFSSKSNFNSTDCWLFSSDKTLKINLYDIFYYRANLEIDRKDYSPQNTVLSFKPSMGQDIILYKDATQKLFALNIFTDFVGLDKTKPNGLVQVELNKKFNMYSRMSSLGRTSISLGFLNLFNFETGLTKIEENNQSLNISSTDKLSNNEITRDKYVGLIDILKHQRAYLGFNFNLLTLALPVFKSKFQVNYGIKWAVVSLTDSLKANNSGMIINSGRIDEMTAFSNYHRLDLTLNLFPEKRYGFSGTYSFNWANLYDPNIFLVSTPERYRQGKDNNFNHLYYTFFINAFINTNGEKGKVFLRLKLHYLDDDPNVTFYQAQLGYSLYLIN